MFFRARLANGLGFEVCIITQGWGTPAKSKASSGFTDLRFTLRLPNAFAERPAADDERDNACNNGKNFQHNDYGQRRYR